MNVLEQGNTLYACHPDLMMVAGCPEVLPWSYLLARFPAKKESEFFYLNNNNKNLKKKKKKTHNIEFK